jgi:thiamine biosynthesis lipoprotein ApbE
MMKFTLMALALALAAAGCSGKPVEVIETRLAMDTEITIHTIAPTDALARKATAAAWQEMDLCIGRLDARRGPSEGWKKGDEAAQRDPAQIPSDTWLINDGAGKWSAMVDPLTVSCLAAAKEAWEASGGAFDPTVGPLMDLWREAEKQGHAPTEDQIAKARALVGMNELDILSAMVQKSPGELGMVAPGTPPPKPDEMVKPINSVGLQKPGMKLDLGGIAKGYIAGRMAQRMKQAGATAGMVAAAGDIYAFGDRPAGLTAPGADARWGVAVQDPRDPEGRTPYTYIHLKDQAVDTSGHYYRGFTIEGKRYSHILDPRTGRPVSNAIASVTVVSADPAVSDSLATAIAVLGVKDGLAMVEKLQDIECLVLEVGPPEGSPEGTPPPEPEANGAPPKNATLIAHRTSGFAVLEFKPAKAAP